MAVNETGAERGSSLVFLCVGGGGEQVVLRVDCGRGPPPPPPLGGGCVFVVGVCAQSVPHAVNACVSLVPRCCTYTATRAPCPSAASVRWAGTAATASSTSRRRCRTRGPSPSSCWPTPSKAARPSRSVPPHPSPVSLVLPGTENLSHPPFQMCADVWVCHGTVTPMSPRGRQQQSHEGGGGRAWRPHSLVKMTGMWLELLAARGKFPIQVPLSRLSPTPRPNPMDISLLQSEL